MSTGGSDWLGKLLAVLVGGAVFVFALMFLIAQIVAAITQLVWTLLTGAGVLIVLVAVAIAIVLAALHLRSHADIAQLRDRIQGERWSPQQVQGQLEHVRQLIQRKSLQGNEHPILSFVRMRSIEGLHRKGAVLVHELAARELPPVRLRKGHARTSSLSDSGQAAAESQSPVDPSRSQRNGGWRRSGAEARIRERSKLIDAWRKEVQAFMGNKTFDELTETEQQLAKQIDTHYEERLQKLLDAK
jgi:hypothetical protein